MTLSSKLMRWAGRPLCAACMHEGTVWQLLAAICPDCTRGASAGGCAAMGAMVVALRLGSGEPLPLQFLPAPPPALPAPQRKAGCGAAGLLCGARQPRLPGALLLGVRGEACGGWPARGRQRLGWPAPRGWLWWMPIPAAAAAVGSRPSPMPLLPYCWATPPHHNTHTHTHTHTHAHTHTRTRTPPQHEHFRAYYPAHRRSAQAILLASSALALCYNLAHSLMIKRISAVATTVVGEFKILALLLLSAFLLGTSPPPPPPASPLPSRSCLRGSWLAAGLRPLDAGAESQARSRPGALVGSAPGRLVCMLPCPSPAYRSPAHPATLTPSPCAPLPPALPAGEKSEFTPKMTTGCTLALAGFAAYSHTKLVAARQRQRRQQTGSE